MASPRMKLLIYEKLPPFCIRILPDEILEEHSKDGVLSATTPGHVGFYTCNQKEDTYWMRQPTKVMSRRRLPGGSARWGGGAACSLRFGPRGPVSWRIHVDWGSERRREVLRTASRRTVGAHRGISIALIVGAKTGLPRRRIERSC
jgi:hypothetical protein